MARTEPRYTPPAPVTTCDRIITTREMIQRTSLSRTTLWRLSREGVIPAPVQITPSRIGWRESQVAAWLDARTPRTPEAA